MINDYFVKGTMSESMKNNIYSYYIELNEKLEAQTITEIAHGVGVDPKTIYVFIRDALLTFSENELYKIVMLCTKFSNSNPCFEAQMLFNEKYKTIIKRRAIVKHLRDRINSSERLDKDVKSL